MTGRKILKIVFVQNRELKEELNHNFFETIEKNEGKVVYFEESFETLKETILQELRELSIERGQCIGIVKGDDYVECFKQLGIPVIEKVEENSEVFSKAYMAVEGFEEVDYTFLNRILLRINKEPWEILETKRCLLRELQVSDIEELYEIYKDNSITQYMEPLFEDIEEEKKYQQAYIDHVYAFWGYGVWGVFEKESGRFIGRAGISNRDINGKSEVEIGYMIRKEYQRKGFATEVCTGIIEYVKRELDLEELNCLVDKENYASVKLAENLGFKWKEAVYNEKQVLQRYILNVKQVK